MFSGRRDRRSNWFELIAPLVDSQFAARVKSDLKVPPADVIEDLIKDIEADEKEIRPGLSNDLYEAWRESPDKAFELATSAVNA
jgi:uncharacterized oxidoreductase